MTTIQKIIKICAIGFAVFLIINILSFIMMALGFAVSFSSYGNAKGEDFNYSYNENIEQVKIDLSTSSLVIETGEQFSVDAKSVSSSFSSEVKNRTLIVKETEKWFFSSRTHGKIIVTVPKDVILNDLDIDTGAGRIEVIGIRADKFDLNQGAGSIKIQDSSFSKTSIDGGAGEIVVSSSTLNNLSLDAGVGRVKMEASILGNSDIECGVGEIDITLLGQEEDYQLNLEKGLGSLEVNGKGYSSESTYGSGSNRIHIEGGVGSISVSFEKNNQNGTF